MKYILIILIIIAFVIGIFDLKFMLECKKEQKNNKAEAFIYVGDKKIIWIFGILFYIISVLEWVILLFSLEIASLFLFLFCCCMVQLGFATFLCQHFTYSAVFIKKNEVFYYAERKLKNKNLDFIVANDITSSDTGFGSEDNKVVILSKNNEKLELEKMSKKKVASNIFDMILEKR